MKKFFFIGFSAMILCTFVNANNVQSSDSESSSFEKFKDDDFQQLAEPEKKVSGAYCGIGFGTSIISHKINFYNEQHINAEKSTSNQFDISLIGGFGTAFFKRYYAGIEMELFKRSPKKDKNIDINENVINIVHKSTFGLNMDVRLGYQFPQYGTLIYFTVGFARIMGEAKLYAEQNINTKKISFGSYYPNIGFGLEYKINHQWNIRGDYRCAITSKDNKTKFREYQIDAKPFRMAFRISVTRTI